MKAIVLAVFVALAVGFSQAKAQIGVFTSMEACEASSAVYTPAFLSGHKPLEAGERLVTLAQRQCGEMFIAGGRWAIVAQAAGTEMVANSSGVITRRWDCGNRARGFVIPRAPIIPSTASQLVEVYGEIQHHHTFDTLQVKVQGEVETATTAIATSSSWCGTTCRRLLLGGAILGTAIAISEHNNWWRGKDAPADELGAQIGPAFNILGLPIVFGSR